MMFEYSVEQVFCTQSLHLPILLTGSGCAVEFNTSNLSIHLSLIQLNILRTLLHLCSS